MATLRTLTRLAALSIAAMAAVGCRATISQERIDSFQVRSGLEIGRASLGEPDVFPRFVVPDQGTLLREADLNADDVLLIVERGGERRAFLAAELTYHHVAQGNLGGQPYLVTF